MAKVTEWNVSFADERQQRQAGGADESKLHPRKVQSDQIRKDGSHTGKKLKEVQKKDEKMKDGSHEGKKYKEMQQMNEKRARREEEEKKTDYEKPKKEKKQEDEEPRDNLLIGLCIANAVLTVVALVLVVYYVVVTAAGCPSGLPEAKIVPNPQDLLANGVLDLQNVGFGQVETTMLLYANVPANNITFVRLFGIDGQKKAILFGGGSDSKNMRRLYGAFCSAKDTSTIGANDKENLRLTLTWSRRKNEFFAYPPVDENIADPRMPVQKTNQKTNASCFLGLKVYAFTVEGSGELGSGKGVGGKVLSVKITP